MRRTYFQALVGPLYLWTPFHLSLHKSLIARGRGVRTGRGGGGVLYKTNILLSRDNIYNSCNFVFLSLTRWFLWVSVNCYRWRGWGGWQRRPSRDHNGRGARWKGKPQVSSNTNKGKDWNKMIRYNTNSRVYNGRGTWRKDKPWLFNSTNKGINTNRDIAQTKRNKCKQM